VDALMKPGSLYGLAFLVETAGRYSIHPPELSLVALSSTWRLHSTFCHLNFRRGQQLPWVPALRPSRIPQFCRCGIAVAKTQKGTRGATGPLARTINRENCTPPLWGLMSMLCSFGWGSVV